ncbi:hypothetical protein VHUM_01899 [Vanrija humicola]|uniref:RNA polymerase II elongation factor ELL N-terminal domain-containing protein n=1 Tax=Vanrija humicola TaxID=5417 RepID=A0A7D8V715_VANHU|nr:hypothetical protein VHUM_01899 [Vanrija humicola]
MPLPGGTIPLTPSEPGAVPPPAFLVKFPEDTWNKLAAAASSGADVSFTVDEDGLSINLPGQNPLFMPVAGTSSTELYQFEGPSLVPVGTATARLQIPINAAAAGRALDRQRQERAERATGRSQASTPTPRSTYTPAPAPVAAVQAMAMARTQSGPAATTLPAAPVASNAATERIPLKTRVVQLLAVGPQTWEEILARTGGEAADVERITKIDGTKTDGPEGVWTLKPQQYAKIKIADWTYTREEKVTVIALARKAFDELNLPSDAYEREDLARKERDALSAGASSSASSQPTTPPDPVPPKVQKQLSPPKRPDSRTESRAERHDSPAPSGAAKKPAAKDKERTKVGKQIAKMRTEMAAKRASSLPNSKSADGTASPRLPSQNLNNHDDKAPEKAKAKAAAAAEKPASQDNGVKRKRPEDDKRPPLKRRGSKRDYTSSEDSDDEDDRRGRARTPVSANSSNGKAKPVNGNDRRRKSPSYTSSDDDEPSKAKKKARPSERADSTSPNDSSRALPKFKRKVPPAPLDLDGKVKGGDRGDRGERDDRGTASPSAKSLQRRYDELYPKYEKLTAYLSNVYHAAERVREGSPVALTANEDVAAKVAQWEELHRDLDKIRRHLGGGA